MTKPPVRHKLYRVLLTNLPSNFPIVFLGEIVCDFFKSWSGSFTVPMPCALCPVLKRWRCEERGRDKGKKHG